MSRPRQILALLFLFALVVVIVVLREPAAARVLDLIVWVDGLGWIAPAAFVAIFTLAVPALVPAAPLLLGGGVLFGPVLGTLYGTLGNLAGGVVAFSLARYFARMHFERKLAAQTGFQVMNRAGADLDKGTGYYVLLGGGIAATIVVSVLLGRRARRILSEHPGGVFE